MKNRRSFNREVELGIKSKAQLCREHDLSPSVLDRWTDQYARKGTDAFPNAGPYETPSAGTRIHELEALVGRQALEIEFLKASTAH